MNQQPFCGGDALSKLAQAGQRLRLKRRESLFHQGAVFDRLYLQRSGTSLLYTVTSTGSRRVFDLCAPGSIINPGSVGENVACCHCEMLSPGEVLALPRDTVLSAMHRDWDLTQTILLAQQRRVRRMSQQLRNTVSGLQGAFRMAALLSELAEEFGVPAPEGVAIDLALSVSLLGDMLGMPRETASRLRKALLQQGVISLHDGQIVVRRQPLQALLQSGQGESSAI